MPETDSLTVFRAGVGTITPTDRFPQAEVEASMVESQKPVEDPAVVCMDERRDIREPQPVREKLAGGNANTFLKAAVAIGWSGFSKEGLEASPDALLEEAADFLVDAGETLGAHRHAHDVAELEEDSDNRTGGGVKKTGCGAIDNGAQIDHDAADHAMDDEWVEQARTDLGDAFNLEHWQVAQKGYQAMADDVAWQAWDHGKIQNVVEARDGTVEVLDAVSDAFAEDIDNAESRHGHFAEGATINHRKGASNDRDHSRIPAFQVDVDPMVRMAEAASADADEFSRLLHAEVMRQYATAYRLTKDMRLLRLWSDS